MRRAENQGSGGSGTDGKKGAAAPEHASKRNAPSTNEGEHGRADEPKTDAAPHTAVNSTGRDEGHEGATNGADERWGCP